MIVRNIPFNKLNDKEKKIVIAHYNVQHQILLVDGKPFFECEGHEQCQTLEGFWEAHREGDTDNGTYDGWIEAQL